MADNKMYVKIGQGVYNHALKLWNINGEKEHEHVILLFNNLNPYLFYPSRRFENRLWYIENKTENNEEKIRLRIKRDAIDSTKCYFAFCLIGPKQIRYPSHEQEDVREVDIEFLWYKVKLNL